MRIIKIKDKGSYIFPAPKPQTEESFWPDETIHYELDSKDFAIALDEPIYLMENEEQKPLSEVEKAQASVKEWKTKVETYEKELHFAKKNSFSETVDILVKAYLNDTLVHNNCYACAVGNIVAARNGYHYTNCLDHNTKRLALVENSGLYCNDGVGGKWYSVIDDNCDSYPERVDGEKEISSTGYNFDEVIRIENAFERAHKGKNEDEWMFNGLMAVVDVLAEIHGIDLKSKEEAKLLFVKETSRD